MKKFIYSIVFLFILNIINAQVSNDDCINATPITLDATGNACLIGTTTNAIGTTFTSHPCWPAGQDIPDVWYSFVSTGANNVITITPNGATPAQQVAVTLTNQACGTGGLSTCAIAASNAGSATANWTYPIGTTVWVNVGTVVAAGGFQICVSSTTPPPTPGSSCATASIICDKNPFTLSTFPNNTNILSPSCFGGSLQRPVFYKFTVGQTGTCAWSADPTGNVEYDWVMYDITNSCPNNGTAEFGCNFNYAGASGAAVGMQAGSTTNCPIISGPISAQGEFCPAINVTAGRTYLIIIDNYSDNGTGFNFTWGGTFTIAPVSQFTINNQNSITSCAPPLTVNFNNTSISAASQTWNFGNGNTSTAVSPSAETYTNPGTYIVSLTTTSTTGCVDVLTRNITIGTPPTVTVPNNLTVCAGQTIPIASFTSTPVGATYTWANSNTAIGLAASGNANINSFTAQNTTSSQITSVITVTPTLNGCPGVPSSYTLTVDPGGIPTFDPVNPICQGSTFTSLPASSTNGITGSWLPAPNNNATTTYTFTPDAGQCSNTAILEVIVTTGIPSTFNSLTAICEGGSLVLPSASNEGFTGNWSPAISNAASQTYTFTPNNGQCALTATLTSTINPIPVLSAINSQTVCTGQQVNGITFSSSVSGSTINWTNTQPGIGLSTSGSGNISSFTALNTGNTSLTGAITATPSANGCDGFPQTFSITIDPIPVLDAIGSQTVCAGQTVNSVSFASSVTNTTVDWTNTTSGIGLASSGTATIVSFSGINSGNLPLTGTISATPTANGCIGLPQTFSVTVNPNPTDITSQITPETCSSSNAMLIITNANGGNSPYQFSFNGGTNAIAPDSIVNLSAGIYTLTVTDANNCVYTKTVSIDNIAGPDASFTANQLTGLDSINVVFTNQSSSGANISYYWNFGNGNSDTTTSLTFSPTQLYYGINSYNVSLIATNGNSLCNDTARLFIYVDISPYIEVPNVFSPNGDGINENFSVKYRGYKELNLLIFNRWGNKLFETASPEKGWNGENAKEGTYFYIITGKANNNKDFEAKGYLTLVR
jgi:gliding motility-associated-like protein